MMMMLMMMLMMMMMSQYFKSVLSLHFTAGGVEELCSSLYDNFKERWVLPR